MRVGFGYDVHKLVKNRPLILGGVTIDYPKGLLGHSDADVLLHAIADSLLGAAAKGDIGKHFPPDDPAYKDISSMTLLAKTVSIITEKGFRIVNMDSTIVCEEPKLLPYIPVMIENISKVLRCNAADINIKAKTEEGMGITGSCEAIKAYAIALITKKGIGHDG